MTRGMSGESYQPDPKYSSLEAIQARRSTQAQKLGETSLADCDDAGNALKSEPKPGLNLRALAKMQSLPGNVYL